MNLEKTKFESMPKIEIEESFRGFVPDEFENDPMGYFERKGENIKKGEIKYAEEDRIREDPTCVKDLPVWTDEKGAELRAVGKKVNITKGQVGRTGNPFYEYEVMKIVNELGLPCARPILKAEQEGEHLIIMERIPGTRWAEKDLLRLEPQLKQEGYSDEDIEDLKKQAGKQMEEMKKKFAEAGITRKWKLKDMVFDIDIKNKRVRKITPTDWERTIIRQSAGDAQE